MGEQNGGRSGPRGAFLMHHCQERTPGSRLPLPLVLGTGEPHVLQVQMKCAGRLRPGTLTATRRQPCPQQARILMHPESLSQPQPRASPSFPRKIQMGFWTRQLESCSTVGPLRTSTTSGSLESSPALSRPSGTSWGIQLARQKSGGGAPRQRFHSQLPPSADLPAAKQYCIWVDAIGRLRVETLKGIKRPCEPNNNAPFNDCTS